MPRIEVMVFSHEPNPELSLFQSAGGTAGIPRGVQLRLGNKPDGILGSPPEIVVLILDFGKGVATGLVAAWLYEKLKGRAHSIEVNHKPTGITQYDIDSALREACEAADRERKGE